MKDADNFDEDDDLESVASTVSDELPDKKPGKRIGRPKGARNKFSSDARELLARHGPAAIRQLCRIAAGHSVNRWPVGGGKKETLEPSIRDMLTAQAMIIDRMVPALRANELSGPDNSPLFPQNEAPDFKGIALALVGLAQEGRGPAEAALWVFAEVMDGIGNGFGFVGNGAQHIAYLGGLGVVVLAFHAEGGGNGIDSETAKPHPEVAKEAFIDRLKLRNEQLDAVHG